VKTTTVEILQHSVPIHISGSSRMPHKPVDACLQHLLLVISVIKQPLWPGHTKNKMLYPMCRI